MSDDGMIMKFRSLYMTYSSPDESLYSQNNCFSCPSAQHLLSASKVEVAPLGPQLFYVNGLAPYAALFCPSHSFLDIYSVSPKSLAFS